MEPNCAPGWCAAVLRLSYCQVRWLFLPMVYDEHRWLVTRGEHRIPFLFTLSWVCLSLAAGLVLSAFVIDVFNRLCLALTHAGRAGRELQRWLLSSWRNEQ